MGSEQENHNRWLRRQSPSDLKRLANELAALTREKECQNRDDLSVVRPNAPSENELDAIGRAMKKHPGLTRENAQELVDFFGF